MAYTQTDLDNINKAIATGAETVRIEGKEVGYRSLEDLLKIKMIVEDALNGSGTKMVRGFKIVGEKGL